ncbi:MAG TPA: hypothetical protein PKE65_03085 [Rhizobiaceae bacterium]|nr:hypothetical protein [Rhizobiaceae bacterium]
MRKTLISFALLVASVAPAVAGTVSGEVKIKLQAAMSPYIDSHVVDGIVRHVKLDSGEIVDLVPTKAHPMILTLGDGYVLCTDFRDADGNFVNVDFYVTQVDGRFVVFQSEIANRAPLEALMQKGVVAAVQ